MTTDPQALIDVLNAYKTAVYDKDLAAFAKLYADDVHVFDMWGDWSVQGLEPWVAGAAQWFGSLGTERVLVTVEEVQGLQSHGLATGHATLTYAAVSPEGQVLRSMQNRLSLTVVQSEQGWKIVHQHTSAPIDFNTMKPQLQRVV